jgi:hypothetical protein
MEPIACIVEMFSSRHADLISDMLSRRGVPRRLGWEYARPRKGLSAHTHESRGSARGYSELDGVTSWWTGASALPDSTRTRRIPSQSSGCREAGAIARFIRQGVTAEEKAAWKKFGSLTFKSTADRIGGVEKIIPSREQHGKRDSGLTRNTAAPGGGGNHCPGPNHSNPAKEGYHG